jgi:uncharacterized protein YkwD
MKTIAQFSFLLMTSAALAACGGGGGATAPATATGAAAAAPAPVTMPAAPAAPATYVAGSEQDQAIKLLNVEREKCGFGSLTQDLKLDQAANAHAKFLVENGLSYSHYELAGLPFFTGVQESDRVAAAGYFDPVGAVLVGSVGTLALSQARTISTQVRDLLGAPFHLLNALDSYSVVGVGYAAKIVGANETKALNLTLGKLGTNSLDAAQVYTYPCEGGTGLNAQMVNESPSPIPLNLAQDFRLYGTPVAIKAKTGKLLALTSATINPTTGGPAVPTQIVDLANTPQPALMNAHSAYVLPMRPLMAGTSYTVQLAGTSDGVAFTKTFSFTTAN